jgi:hypothetical protein
MQDVGVSSGAGIERVRVTTTSFVRRICFWTVRISAWLTLIIPAGVFIIYSITKWDRLRDVYQFLFLRPAKAQTPAGPPGAPLPPPVAPPEVLPAQPPGEVEVKPLEWHDDSEHVDLVLRGCNEQGQKVFYDQWPPEGQEPQELVVDEYGDLAGLQMPITLKLNKDSKGVSTFAATLPKNADSIYVENAHEIEDVAIESPHRGPSVELIVGNCPRLKSIDAKGQFKEVRIYNFGYDDPESGRKVSIAFMPTSHGQIPFGAEHIEIFRCSAVECVEIPAGVIQLDCQDDDGDPMHLGASEELALEMLSVGRRVPFEDLLAVVGQAPKLRKIQLTRALRGTLSDAQRAQLKAALPEGCEADK